MLYQIYETQRSLMEPFADFAQAASKLYSNPLSPLGQSQISQRISATYDLIYRLGKDYEKPAFGIQSVPVDGVDVAIHERVEIDKPFCELRRFKRFSDDASTLNKLKDQPVVLMCATGMRSRNAAARVRKLGYTRALSLSGGLGAWRQANLPVETQKA